MKKISTKQRFVAVGSAALVIAGAGTAYAYWTNTGSGTGSAATGSNSPVTITQTSTITGLYPGGAAVDLVGTITNGNSGPVYVNVVTPTITAITNTSDGTPSACAAAGNFTLTTGTVATDLATGANTNQPLGTIKLNDTGSNQDACKNVTIALSYSSN
jgi:hypothetical protein